MANFRPIYIYCLLLIVCAMPACHPEPIDHTNIIVEGWIDPGKHPVVMLHTSYSLNFLAEPDTTQLIDVLAEHMVLFGKVVIFDGQDSVTLTGRVDTNYMPPYIYTSTQIMGEVGRHYTLTATYKGFAATAQTTIPPVATFDSIGVFQVNDKINLVGYANHLEVGAPYIIMARTSTQQQYKICPMGAFRATAPQMAVTINNPIDFAGEGAMLQALFPHTDSVKISVKFARVGESEFLMWDSYMAQNLTQGLFFMETHSNILTNIQGGMGYWCGMGSTEYHGIELTVGN